MRSLIAGHTTHDHYEEGFVAGGCAFYGAQVHARLAGATHLVTVVGEDFSCDDALAALDATVERAGQTTTFANYYPADGPRVQLIEAQAPEVTPDMAPPEWLDAELIHLAPVMGELDLRKWTLAAGDGLVAINVQGWIKVAGPRVDPALLEEEQARGVDHEAHRVIQEPWDVSEEELRGVDIACLSEEDVIGQGDLLDRLLRVVPVVAYTMGERGSLVYVDGEPTAVGIYPTDVVDPTGAGDTFAATFTHKLAAGLDPVDAACYASAAASIVIEDIGARALRRLDEIDHRAAKIAT